MSKARLLLLSGALCLLSACGSESVGGTGSSMSAGGVCAASPVADKVAQVADESGATLSSVLVAMQGALDDSGYDDKAQHDVAQAAYRSVCKRSFADYINDELDRFTLDIETCESRGFKWCNNSLYGGSSGKALMSNEATLFYFDNRLFRVSDEGENAGKIGVEAKFRDHWVDTRKHGNDVAFSLFCSSSDSQSEQADCPASPRDDIDDWIRAAYTDKDDNKTRELLRAELKRHPILTDFVYYSEADDGRGYLKGCYDPGQNHLDWPATMADGPLPKLVDALRKAECEVAS